MAQAKTGDTVHIHYTGRLGDGTVFDSSRDRDPLSFTLGQGQVIPGFEAAVAGMETGESKTAEIASGDAYGPRRPEMEMSVPRTQLPEGMNPEVGQQLQMQTPDGQAIPVRVTGTSEEAIDLDANHPLAGQDLIFDIELVKVG